MSEFALKVDLGDQDGAEATAAVVAALRAVADSLDDQPLTDSQYRRVRKHQPQRIEWEWTR
ncbi:hypothetical protein [Nocardia ignorata]|uniref:Uncharacterized protein n=1 Tax=Nocardia ignorata TaxID=145285 RepID=A0A4R6P0D4_NOCIG|nr:hypothetical protein [Nocardia ignorata]TDP29845.1 hypothetical protein DFR75_112114 [Nocardia ignorata]